MVPFQNTPIPLGLCQCGCGRQTSIATASRNRRGQTKGQPFHYLPGHGMRRLAADYEVVDSGHGSSCWRWLGTLTKKGYGQLRRDGYRFAHIWTYEQRHGPGSAKPQLDHLCRNRWCVNPDHLEPVTNTVNTLRGTKAKLTADDVRVIKNLEGIISTKDIAHQFDISAGHVRGVQRGLYRRDG